MTQVYTCLFTAAAPFLCAGIIRARRPATRGFSARGYSFDAHDTDGRRGLGFAGLPRGLQAHPPENNAFSARKAKRARAKGCSGTRAALLTTYPPDKYIRTPRAETPPTLLYGEHQVCIFAPVSFEKTPQRADRTITSILAPVRGGRRPAYGPPAHRSASHRRLRPVRPRGKAALSDFTAAEKRAKTGLKNKSKCDIIAA